MKRLFVGLDIPESLSVEFNRLQTGIEGARWVPSQNFHITLAFIGEVDDATVQKATEALGSIRMPALSLHAQAAGVFGSAEKPHALWMGVAADAALMALKDKVDEVLEAQGVPFEKRAYRPHVTMAYFKSPDVDHVQAFLKSKAGYVSQQFSIGAFHLYESMKENDKSVYKKLGTYGLDF